MTKIIITSSGDWADEFDLEGFAIYDADRWEELKKEIPEEGAFDYSYGSNEEVSFDDKDDYLSYLEEKEISDEEINVLAKILNINIDCNTSYWHEYGYTYGLFVGP